MKISVQTEDFSVEKEAAFLRSKPNVGALVLFVGSVRDISDNKNVSCMTLQHYPGMTEKALESIVKKAKERWNIEDATVIHRVGPLKPTEQIVFVGVSSMHRGEAFKACEFIIDFLKTEAPFWKKEQCPEGDRWVEAKDSDEQSKNRWIPDDNN